MFTGLIQDMGTVRAIEKHGDTRIEIETALDLSAMPLGCSICCSGACLTVVQKGANWFAVDVSSETLSKTGIGLWTIGARINLEPSLRLGDELGGHFVFGHVDGQAQILEVKEDGASRIFRIKAEANGLIAAKGSIALDGVSLTVNEVQGDVFTVNIIPHTWEKTTMQFLKPGDRVNLEFDMLARYVAQALRREAA